MKLKNVFLIWLMMPILGVTNGIFRQLVLVKYLDEPVARQLSVLTLIILLILYIRFAWKKSGVVNSKSAWVAGVTWTVLTVAFEVVLGHFLSGLTWQEMLADYNVAEGRLWPLVLVTLLIFPSIYFHIRQHNGQNILNYPVADHETRRQR